MDKAKLLDRQNEINKALAASKERLDNFNMQIKWEKSNYHGLQGMKNENAWLLAEMDKEADNVPMAKNEPAPPVPIKKDVAPN